MVIVGNLSDSLHRPFPGPWPRESGPGFALRSVRESKSLIACSGLDFQVPIDFLDGLGLSLVIGDRCLVISGAVDASKPDPGSPR